MTKYESEKYLKAAELKSRGLTYTEIGIELSITRQRAQQLCKPPIQVYELLKCRANNRCERCRIELKRGHAHHVRYGLERWNLDDLLYLCNGCHTSEHNPKLNIPDNRPKNAAAQALGRLGGRVRSEAKKASGKRNMEKARAAKLSKLQTTENIENKVLDK